MNPRLFKEVRSVRVLLGFVVLQGVLNGILILLQAYDLADIVNRVYIDHQGFLAVGHVLWSFLGVIVLRAFLALFGESGGLILATQIQARLRRDLGRRLLASGPLYVNGQQTGELVNTLIKGVEDLEPYFARYVPQVTITALVPTVILVEAFIKDWITGVILLVTLPLIPFFMILIGRQAESKTQKQWRMLSRLSAHFLDVLQGLTTLKLLGQSQHQTQGIQRASDEFRRATMASLRIAFLSALVLELLASLSMAMVAVGIGLRLIAGLMSFRTSFFLLVLVPDFYLPWRMLGTRFHDGLNGMEAAKRIVQILDAPPQATGNGTQKFDNMEYPLVFEHVGFVYDGRQRPAIAELNGVVYPGDRIAIVGPSGAGKSTLLSLVMGFAHPSQGSIRFGSLSLAEIDWSWWRGNISFLTQNPYIFAGSVRDNLLWVKPFATVSQLQDVLEMSGAAEYVHGLPYGLDTPLEEQGRGLSGGQKQRLAMARAYLKDAPIVLMDEPTANLDPETEASLWEQWDRLLSNRTALVVAHRLSTARRLETIWVMNQGHLVQQGPRRELENSPGLYRDLVRAYGTSGREGLYAALSPYA